MAFTDKAYADIREPDREMLHLRIKKIVVHEDMTEGKRNTTVEIHFNFMNQGNQLTVKSEADVFKNRIQGNEVYPLWRGNIYKIQSNPEVSQSIRLLFNYLGMTHFLAGG